jgi:hypothetical protein
MQVSAAYGHLWMMSESGVEGRCSILAADSFTRRSMLPSLHGGMGAFGSSKCQGWPVLGLDRVLKM